jgi:hypothetical protein
MNTTARLKERAERTRELIHANRVTLSMFDIGWSERSAVVVPLAVACMDTADTVAFLLATEPEQRWVQALALQRVQMEYMLRAAFFAGAASEKETDGFRRKGAMPKRGKSPIYLMQLASEAASNLQWNDPKLLETVKHHHRDLSGFVHGGKELLAIYTQHQDWGDLTMPWDDLIQPLENTAIFAQLALSVLMRLSRLRPVELDAAVRPAYERGMVYFGKRGAGGSSG